MFGKIACAMALAATTAHAVRLDASEVCISNYLNQTISYYAEDAFFVTDSATVAVDTATTSCQNLTTFLSRGAVAGDGYNIWSWMGTDPNGGSNLPEEDTNFGYPFITYEPSAGTVNYFCGWGNWDGPNSSQEYCCCAKGATDKFDICYWDGDTSYTSCEAPSHITQPN